VSDHFHAAMYDREVVRRILVLREDLVRHDENLAAWHLMSKAVPFFVLDHPAIIEARDAQYQMTKHVIPLDELREADRGADPYAAYYQVNEHEARFEVQYGAEVSEAHRLPRIQYLLDWLDGSNDVLEGTITANLEARRRRHVLDLAANDGFMAARLSMAGYPCDCLDLHPGNCEIARERKKTYPLIGRVVQGACEHVNSWAGDYSVVVMFEVLEHVRDPLAALQAAAMHAAPPDGRLFVSVPNGACENGNLPNWDHVEPKGHVRVFRPEDLRALLEQVGEVEDLQLGVDGVLVARVKPR
jgi:2-polyprenyl-3-methyl-5-hydroxy-6-metoxy-1,4-benzoquinol methylase